MHNPLRSEGDVFRAVVIVGIGAGAVIAVTLLTRPAVGAALLAAEVGLGIGLLWRGAQGGMPRRAEVAHRDDPTYRVLVLANETVGGRALLAEIENRCKGRSSEILVVVPALPGSGSSTGPRTSTELSRRRRRASTSRCDGWRPRASTPAATWATITSRTPRSRTRCAPSPPTR